MSSLLACMHFVKYWHRMYNFKAFPETAPQYLEELVVQYQSTRSIRSESGAFLAVPTTRGVTYGNRCFRKAAATLWNNLPVTIKKCKTLDIFKKKIKLIFSFQLFLAEYIMYLAGKNYVFLKM